MSLSPLLFAFVSILVLQTSDGEMGSISLPPPVPGSFTTALAAFPAQVGRSIDGFPLASRLVAATGRTIYLWKTFGGKEWLPIAVLDNGAPEMDPSFLAISPDGEKVALGTGLGMPLYVVPTALLSTEAPPLLAQGLQRVRSWRLDYYWGCFRDGRYLFINTGGVEYGTSYIYAIDTESSSQNEITLIIGPIPGASAGLAFDAHGNLVTGIGWDPDDQRTGELRIFGASKIDDALGGGGSLDYGVDGEVVAEGILSAAFLGFDDDGNLLVGGGDVFGTSGHYGYAVIIDAVAVQRAAGGGVPASSDEIAVLQPDPCGNDDSTQILAVPGSGLLVVTANLASTPPDCASIDWSEGPPVTAPVFVLPGAPDRDGDGVPDGLDPDFGAQRLFDLAELSRLVDALDSAPGNSNFTNYADYNGDGAIDDRDLLLLRQRWGLPLPSGFWGSPP